MTLQNVVKELNLSSIRSGEVVVMALQTVLSSDVPILGEDKGCSGN